MRGLKNKFMECPTSLADDGWKLGLCYFVHIILFRTDPLAAVEPHRFELVENEIKFFSYPWGRLTFDKTILELNRDMTELARNIPVKKEMKGGETLKLDEKKKRKRIEVIYHEKDEETKDKQKTKLQKKPSKSCTLHGLAIALQYWAYEAIPSCKGMGSNYSGPVQPRMMGWKIIKSPKSLDIAILLNNAK